MSKENIVLKSAFIRKHKKSHLLFEVLIRVHQVHMKGGLVLRIIFVSSTKMIEDGIDGFP